MKRKDWTGVRQGRITVLGYAGDGTEIYEGDIFQVKAYEPRFEVYFKNGVFEYRQIGSSNRPFPLRRIHFDSFILGNIHGIGARIRNDIDTWYCDRKIGNPCKLYLEQQLELARLGAMRAVGLKERILELSAKVAELSDKL